MRSVSVMYRLPVHKQTRLDAQTRDQSELKAVRVDSRSPITDEVDMINREKKSFSRVVQRSRVFVPCK